MGARRCVIRREVSVGVPLPGPAEKVKVKVSALLTCGSNHLGELWCSRAGMLRWPPRGSSAPSYNFWLSLPGVNQ